MSLLIVLPLWIFNKTLRLALLYVMYFIQYNYTIFSIQYSLYCLLRARFLECRQDLIKIHSTIFRKLITGIITFPANDGKCNNLAIHSIQRDMTSLFLPGRENLGFGHFFILFYTLFKFVCITHFFSRLTNSNIHRWHYIAAHNFNC